MNSQPPSPHCGHKHPGDWQGPRSGEATRPFPSGPRPHWLRPLLGHKETHTFDLWPCSQPMAPDTLRLSRAESTHWWPALGSCMMELDARETASKGRCFLCLVSHAGKSSNLGRGSQEPPSTASWSEVVESSGSGQRGRAPTWWPMTTRGRQVRVH